MSQGTITPVFPLRENDEGKFEVYDVSDTTKVVDQNIKMVLLTRKGEWIGRQDFGVGLHNYLFENPYDIENGTNQPPLRAHILNQLATNIPYITIEELKISVGQMENSLNVKIQYYINDSGAASTFDLTLTELP